MNASPATVPPLMDLATLDANVEGFDFMISAASAHIHPIANNRKLETVESETLNSRISSLSPRSTSCARRHRLTSSVHVRAHASTLTRMPTGGPADGRIYEEHRPRTPLGFHMVHLQKQSKCTTGDIRPPMDSKRGRVSSATRRRLGLGLQGGCTFVQWVVRVGLAE